MQRRLLFLSRNQTDGAEMVPLAFQNRGWEVDTASPTVEAITSLQRHSYDLVIMEVARPGSENMGLCGVIRQHSQVPLLLLVASVARGDVIEGLRRGADGYVVAPFDLRELVVRAEALVRRATGQVRHSV
ncbi:MAG: response regulator [Anaerolineae bacterium]|nr:response regulator [Anaerolineae bacterium]